MNEIDVYNDRSKQNQAERYEASDEQQQAAEDLKDGDHMQVMRHEKRFGEVARWPRRRLRDRNKVQENVLAEDNKDQSEKDASNNGSDFHPRMMT